MEIPILTSYSDQKWLFGCLGRKVPGFSALCGGRLGDAMDTGVPQGVRFSLLYLQSDAPLSDSVRLRKRLIRCFDEVVGDNDEPMGCLLESELGIDVLQRGPYSSYVEWDRYLHVELRDVLDTITLVARYRTAPLRELFCKKVSRILAEENASYRIDPQGGLHPNVDSAYRAKVESTVQGLSSRKFEAAREFIRKADEGLLPAGDKRDAIKAAFDAVENIFKVTFTGATALNKGTVQNYLRPFLEVGNADPVARRAALKLAEALIDWADGCHNYRHAPGEAEPPPPPEQLAIMLVSQGIDFARWLAGLQSGSPAT